MACSILQPKHPELGAQNACFVHYKKHPWREQNCGSAENKTIYKLATCQPRGSCQLRGLGF